MLLLFLVFPGKLPLGSENEEFWVIFIILRPALGQFDIFLTDVIKVDNTEGHVLRLSLEHIHVLLVFSVFPLKLLFFGQYE